MTGVAIIFSEGGACALARLGSCAASEIETSASQLRHGDAEIKSTRGSSGAHLSDIAILAGEATRGAVPSWVRVHLVSCRCLDEAWVSPSRPRNWKLGRCLPALLQGRTRDAEDAKPPITSSSAKDRSQTATAVTVAYATSGGFGTPASTHLQLSRASSRTRRRRPIALTAST